MKKNSTQGKSYSLCQTTQSAIQQQLKQFGIKNEILKNNIKQQIDILNSPKQVLTEKNTNRQITPNNVSRSIMNQQQQIKLKSSNNITSTPTNNNKNKVSYISNKLAKIVDENLIGNNNPPSTAPTNHNCGGSLSNQQQNQHLTFFPITPLQSNIAKSPSTANTNTTDQILNSKNILQESSSSLGRTSKQLLSPSSRSNGKKSSPSPSPGSGCANNASLNLLSPNNNQSQTKLQQDELINNNNNLNQNNNQCKNICANCPDKKGKYFIQMDEGDEETRTYYCSRCSITLAQQGIKVINMDETQRSSIANVRSNPSTQSTFNNGNSIRPNSNFHLNTQPQSPINISRSVQHQEQSNNVRQSVAQNNSIIVNSENSIINQQQEVEEQRKKELNLFSQKLKSLKQLSLQTHQQMKVRKNDLVAFYEKQKQKIEKLNERLLSLIESEKSNATAKLDNMKNSTTQLFSKHESNSQKILKDLEDTYSDVNQNVDKILKHMDQAPFQRILQQYEEKLANYQQYISRLYQDNLTLVKLNYCSTKNYQKKIDEEIKPLIIQLFSYIQTSTNLLKKDSIIESESPNPLEKSKTKGSIYISFENKELFENAIKSSLSVENKNQGTLVLSIMNNGNLKTMTNSDNCASTYSDCSGNGCSAFTNGSYINLNNESAISNNQKIINVSTTEPNIKESDEEELKENTKFLTEANDKENTQTATEESANKKECLSNKYNNLLDKINKNQNQTKYFYDNVFKTALQNLPFSPQPTLGKDCFYQSCQTTNPKDIKQNEEFSSYLENKLKDQVEQSDSSGNGAVVSYQRTLFSSSPHFKDQDVGPNNNNNNEENLLSF